ncbi:MAG: hypothetical protein VCE74_10735 [Alphaproteobacteria bacterium]
MSTAETLDRLALPLGGTGQEQAAATTQAGIFALDVALSIVEAPTDEATAAKRLHYVAERCNELTDQLARQTAEALSKT